MKSVTDVLEDIMKINSETMVLILGLLLYYFNYFQKEVVALRLLD